MKHTQLGNTGIFVPPICFGSLTMSPLQHNFATERAAEVYSYAAKMGLNFIDTAQYYQNYHQIAAGIKLSKADFTICTKSYAYTKQMAADAVEEARTALGRDRIDIFMLHEQESEHTLRGHAEALSELYRLKSLGVIGAVGLSTHFVAGVRGAVKFGLDIVHPMLNVTGLGIADGTRADMESAVKDAFECGMGVYTMKAFGGGNLYARAADCLNYAFDFPFAHSVALGMKSESEIDENIHFYKTRQFTDSYAATGKHIHIEEYCTGCGCCVAKCSQSALHIYKNKCVCDTAKCLLCGYCSAACPDFAIKIL